MAEPDLEQLTRAFRELESFAAAGPLPGSTLPQLPDPADDALLDHLAVGVQATEQALAAPGAGDAAAHIAHAVRELNAAIALLQEWVIPA